MSDTVITPAALFNLRSEVAELRESHARTVHRLAALEEKLKHLDGISTTINELDDRADESERRHEASDKRHDASDSAIQRVAQETARLVSGITVRDLAIERVERYMLSVLEHMRIPVPA